MKHKIGDLVVYNDGNDDYLAEVINVGFSLVHIEIVMGDKVWVRPELLEDFIPDATTVTKCECGAEATTQSKYKRSANKYEHALWCGEFK
jgi:hypothetical protein